MNATKMMVAGCLIGVAAFCAAPLFSHCQIPCGIYDDQLRFRMITEDITTVEKAMKQITALSDQPEKNYNQIVRWVQNKEAHADRIAKTVTQYFLMQRVKPIDEKDKPAYQTYIKKLTLAHRVMVQAMKCKQTTDLDEVKQLRSLLTEFREVYFSQQEHQSEGQER